VTRMFQRLVASGFGRPTSPAILPALDGPLRPNQALETAPTVLAADGIDNLTAAEDTVWYSTGNAVRSLDGQQIASLPGVVSCLARGDEQTLAVGFDGGGVAILGGPHDGRMFGAATGLNCPTAAMFLDRDTLVVTNGSADRAPSRWRADLMTGRQSGSIAICRLSTGAVDCLRTGLAWPAGVARGADHDLVVTECWRHRVLGLNAAGGNDPVVLWQDIPAYPSRVTRSVKGHYWIAFLSVRNQLVDFVLQDQSFRQRMVAELPEEDWMAPDLSTRTDGTGPVQANGLWQAGIVKPWSATRSYGLVVKCDPRMRPLVSFHSRAGGTRHGVTSLCEVGDDILVGARGAGRVLRLEGAARQDRLDRGDE